MGRKLAPKAVPYAKQDGSTSWRVRVRVGGRQTTETFPTEHAANVFIARCVDPAIGPERAVELRDREDTRSGGYVPTVRQMLELHLDLLTGVEEATCIEYLKMAERSWLPRLQNLRVDEVEDRDITSWVKAATGTRAPKTIRNEHSLLSAVLNTAVRKQHIPFNPAQGTRLPRAGEEDVEDPNFLTFDEFDRLFSEFAEHWRPMVVWMFGMGTRFSETTAQQKQDLNLEAGRWVGDTFESEPTTRVVRAWKKGRTLGPPKSVASRRTIVIPGEVVDVVEPLVADLKKTDFIFRTITGQPVRHSNFFNRVWKPATLRASICPNHRIERCRCLSGKPEKCLIHTEKDDEGNKVLPEPCGCPGWLSFRPRIHDARHTHASWLIAEGERLDVIQERLGHEDYLTTQRLYGHLLPHAKASAAKAASLAFARTSLAAGPRPRALELSAGG